MDNIHIGRARAAGAAALVAVLATTACAAPSTETSSQPPNRQQINHYDALLGIKPGDTVNIYSGDIRIPRDVTVRMGTRAGKPPDDATPLGHQDITIHNPYVIQDDSPQGMADGPRGSTLWACGDFEQEIFGIDANFLPRVKACSFIGDATNIPIDLKKVVPCAVQSISSKYVMCKGGSMAGRVTQDEVPNKDPNKDPKPTLAPPKSQAGMFKSK